MKDLLHLRPTGWAVLIFTLSLSPAAFILIRAPGEWRITLAIGILVAVVIIADAIDVLMTRRTFTLTDLPKALYLGSTGIVTLMIAPAPTYFARRPRTGLELLLEAQGEIDPPTIVRANPGTEGGTIELPLAPRRRGEVTIEALWVRRRGPFALTRLTRRVPVARTIEVLLPHRGPGMGALAIHTKDAAFGVKPQGHPGEGSEFRALKEYAPGLDTRFIDWKQSARHGKLLVKEFETERNHQVILAFDTGYLMREPIAGIPRLDHAIQAGLALAWVSLRSGDLVGTFGFDARIRHYHAPIRGTQSFPRIESACARLRYHPEETNFVLGLAELNARLHRRALVVVFT
ncbi:MAG TPA: DUF58 domain-containing protein, partial [Stellaceae bacterium]|nr:DUF58 domain-containing protein [Stellaceae bacterium]